MTDELNATKAKKSRKQGNMPSRFTCSKCGGEYYAYSGLMGHLGCPMERKAPQ